MSNSVCVPAPDPFPQENPLFGRLGSESARQAHLLSCLDAGIVDVGGDSLHTDAAEAHAELSTLRTFGPEGIQCVCTCVSVRVQARDWPIAKLRAQLASHKVVYACVCLCLCVRECIRCF